MASHKAHVYVSGRVQGVWFRESTRRFAEELGLSGFVRNLADGRVEAVFEGPEAAVRTAVRFVHDGPEMARVAEVVVDEGPLDEDETRAPREPTKAFRVL
jgi:acylphosphatase